MSALSLPLDPKSLALLNNCLPSPETLFETKRFRLDGKPPGFVFLLRIKKLKSKQSSTFS